MSIKVLDDVWRYSTAKGSELLVLLALADNSDEEHRLCWPSIPYLARKTRLSERQIPRLLRTLEALGEISTEVRPGKSNVYRLKRWQAVTPDRLSPCHSSGRINGDIAVADEPSVDPSVPPGGSAAATRRASAQEVVALYIDTLHDRGVKQIPKVHPARVGREAKRLLEEGIDLELVKAAVQIVARRGITPAAMPNLVMDAQAPRQANGKRYGRGVTTMDMIDRMRRTADEQAASGRVVDLFGRCVSSGEPGSG